MPCVRSNEKSLFPVIPKLSVIAIAFLIVLKTSMAHAEPQEQQQDESAGWKAAVVGSLLLTLATNPLHADSGGMAYMQATDAGALKMLFRWHPEEAAGQLGPIRITNYLQVAYSKWQSFEDSTQKGSNNVLEAIPIFRLGWSEESVLSYVETSVGIALFSTTELNDRRFGSNFQFTDSIAFGGYLDQWDWSFQFQHYSNNSISLPNNGINFYTFNVAYHY